MEPTELRTALCPHCRDPLLYLENHDQQGRLDWKGFVCLACGQRCGYHDPVADEPPSRLPWHARIRERVERHMLALLPRGMNAKEPGPR